MSMKQYKAIDIAKYVVSKCTKDGKPITNLQLQRILFLCQEKSLRQRQVSLFSDEIEMWEIGSVIVDVYYSFCGSGTMTIIGEYFPSVKISKRDKKFVDKIVEENRDKTLAELAKEVENCQEFYHTDPF